MWQAEISDPFLRVGAGIFPKYSLYKLFPKLFSQLSIPSMYIRDFLKLCNKSLATYFLQSFHGGLPYNSLWLLISTVIRPQTKLGHKDPMLAS